MKKLTCKTCGIEFDPPKYNAKRSHYCTPKCRNKFYNLKYRKQHAEWQRQDKIKKALKPSPDKLQCQICGRWYRKVGSHVWQTHKMTAREYRKECGFDVKRGQLTERGRRVMRDHVFSNGTVKNLKKGKKYRFYKGQDGIGRYQRSAQTMERLKNLHKLNKSKENAL